MQSEALEGLYKEFETGSNVGYMKKYGYSDKEIQRYFMHTVDLLDIPNSSALNTLAG